MRSRLLLASVCLSLVACGSEPGGDGDGESSTGDGSGDAGVEVGGDGDGDPGDGDGDPGDGDGDGDGDTSGETGEPVEDPVLVAEDFACIKDMTKVRRFYLTNVLGDLDATLAVADSPTGGEYPVGTLIQLVPTEAMVKRAPGFAPAAHDWEFFSLAVDAGGTEILDRGAEQVVNAFGGNCFGCHAKAEPQWDFVCETDHGCDPLPLTAGQIEAIQDADPRCP